jgi:hypothetical protein
MMMMTTTMMMMTRTKTVMVDSFYPAQQGMNNFVLTLRDAITVTTFDHADQLMILQAVKLRALGLLSCPLLLRDKMRVHANASISVLNCKIVQTQGSLLPIQKFPFHQLNVLSPHALLQQNPLLNQRLSPHLKLHPNPL